MSSKSRSRKSQSLDDGGVIGSSAPARRLRRPSMTEGGHSLAFRVMIYSQDGLGLGHMRRTGSIAAQLLEEYPNACVLTLHDSPLGTFFDLSKNQDCLKLPSIVKIGPGNWEAVKLPIEFNEVLSLRRELIRVAALR